MASQQYGFSLRDKILAFLLLLEKGANGPIALSLEDFAWV